MIFREATPFIPMNQLNHPKGGGLYVKQVPAERLSG